VKIGGMPSIFVDAKSWAPEEEFFGQLRAIVLPEGDNRAECLGHDV